MLSLLDRMGFQQVMDRTVGRQPSEAVGQFEACVPEGAVVTKRRPTEGRLVDEVQRQARVQSIIGRFTRPSPQQVPSAQAQVFGHEQPQPEQVTGNFISQELPHLSFHATGVGGFQPDSFSGALNGQRRRGVFGVQCVEFFFAGRNRR